MKPSSPREWRRRKSEPAFTNYTRQSAADCIAAIGVSG